MTPGSGPRVVVVGSGVAGAATAFALARGGAAVTVLEAQEAGTATAAGAGIVQPWASSAEGPFYELYAAGAAFCPRAVELLRDSGVGDVGYEVCGSLVVDADPGALDAVEARVRERTAGAAVAGTVSRLSPAEATALFPPLAPGLAAVHVSGGARVDGRRLRSGLLEAAQRHGAEVRKAAARVLPGERPVLLAADDRLDADAVVVAAGAWTDRLLAGPGRPAGIEPQRGQLVHLGVAPGTDTGAWPSVLPAGPSYLVPFPGGRVVAGATRETGSGFDPRVTADGLRAVLADALAVAPGLAAATVLETRVGLRPLPRGGLPVLGPLPGLPGWFVATGFGAGGLTMGPLAGHLVAQLVFSGRSDLDLTPFAPHHPNP
jgi:glycine/D-amino acid oxidase-like deaminating enzyme